MNDIFAQLGITDSSQDFNKQDILQLIQTGLKENEPFANYFANTILADLQRKLRDIRIQSSAIEIDGKGISKDINQQIKDGIEEEVDGIVKRAKVKIERDLKPAPVKIVPKTDTPQKQVGVPSSIKPSSKNAKETTKANIQGNDIPSVLGIAPKLSSSNQKQYQELITKLLEKVNSGLPEKINLKDVSLGDLFRPVENKRAGLLQFSKRSNEWNNLQLDIVKKIKNGMPGVFQFKEMSIGDIFTPPSSSGGMSGKLAAAGAVRRYFSWAGVQNKIISRISASLEKKNFKFQNEISLNEIFGSNEKSSLLTALKWNKLQNIIIDKIRKQTNDINPQPQKVKLNEGIKSVEKKESEDAESKDKIPVVKTSPVKKGFRSLDERENTVKVGGFTKAALKDLSGIVGLMGIRGAVNIASKDKVVDGGLPKWVKALGLAGLALMAGGIFAGVKGLFDSGPFKGLEKIISRLSIMAGSKILKFVGNAASKMLGKMVSTLGKNIDSIARIFGKDVLKMVKPVSGLFKGIGAKLASMGGKLFGKSAVKKIPVLGALFGIGFGISRFIQGDIAGGLLEIASGVSSMAPGVGTAISIAIDAFLAVRDIKGGGSKELGKSSAFNKGWREKFLPFIEKIPIIGALVKIPKALGHFSTGNWKEGLKELAFTVPGIEGIYNFISGVNEKATQAKAEGQQKSMSEIIGEMIFEKISSYYKSAPTWMKLLMKRVPFLKDMLIGEAEPKGEEAKYKGTKTLAPAQREIPHETKKTVAQDFIWRKGQQPQQFTERDNVIATKDDKKFEKMLKLLTNQNKKPVNNTQIEQTVQRMHNDVNNLIQKMNNVIAALSSNANRPSGSAPQMLGQLSGISDDAGSIRDPAYVLRSRAWDRIRKGYVVV